jgi:hypothetical protein
MPREATRTADAGNQRERHYVVGSMKLFKSTRFLVVLVALAMVVAACDDDGGTSLSTSSTVLTGGNGSDSGSTTTAPEASDTSSPDTTQASVGTTVDSYEVMARESEDEGDILFILIPQATYTDVDLQNFIGDLLESGTVTWGAEIFDDVTALDAYRKPPGQRSDQEKELIGLHHFASLVEGDTIIYRGPFESSGEVLIGS